MKIRLKYWPNKYISESGDFRNIQLIKLVREITGMGLKEAKCDVVDVMVDHCYPLIEVTYNQYQKFVDEGFGVNIESNDTKSQLVEHCFDIQRQLITNGKIRSAKLMVDVVADVMDSDQERFPF